MNDWTNESMIEWMIEWMNCSEWMNKWIAMWINEWSVVNEWSNLRRNEWRNEWMSEWMNEWISECVLWQCRFLITVWSFLSGGQRSSKQWSFQRRAPCLITTSRLNQRNLSYGQRRFPSLTLILNYQCRWSYTLWSYHINSNSQVILEYFITDYTYFYNYFICFNFRFTLFSELLLLTRKYGSCDALHLEGRPTFTSRFGLSYVSQNVPAYKFNTTATSFAFGNHEFLYDTGILIFISILAIFTAHVQTLIFASFWSNFDIAITFSDPEQ